MPTYSDNFIQLSRRILEAKNGTFAKKYRLYLQRLRKRKRKIKPNLTLEEQQQRAIARERKWFVAVMFGLGMTFGMIFMLYYLAARGLIVVSAEWFP